MLQPGTSGPARSWEDPQGLGATPPRGHIAGLGTDETASATAQLGAYPHATFDQSQIEIAGSVGSLHRSQEAPCQAHKPARGEQLDKTTDTTDPP
jgi:hypothetical protein